ncbi:MAG: hypothetical protein E7164_00760 [Firmicutes bacterium]|nr:hypothetical protein [Bacillota bacterium]
MKIDNLKLNFLDNYCMFYDWLESDTIETVYQVMLYRVSSKTLSDMINYKIRLNDLKLIAKSKILLFSDGFSYVALEFNNEGFGLYKSSLLLSEEIRLNKQVDNLKPTSISYSKVNEDNHPKDLRINNEIRNTILIELNTMEENKDIDKITYLYYEWFNKMDKDFNKMLQTMYKKIKMPLSNSEKKIYDLIKRSYRLV